jgi:uncharacterized protein (DUF58 family)
MEAFSRRYEQVEGWLKPRHSRSQTGTFRSLRPYRHGDSLHRIHWRTSARRDELYVKQYEKHTRPKVTLMLDAYLEEADDERSRKQERLLDRAVSFTATLADEFEDMGVPYGYVSRSPERVSIAPATGRKHRFRVLEALATARSPQDRRPDDLARIMPSGNGRGGGVVVITTDAERPFARLPSHAIVLDARSKEFNDIFSLITD